MSDAFTLALPALNIDEMQIAVGTVAISLFGGKLDAVAVVCGDDRWISTEEDCVRWLAETANIPEVRARGIIRGFLYADDIYEHWKEETVKLVDGIVFDICAGHYAYVMTAADIRHAAVASARASPWGENINEEDEMALTVALGKPHGSGEASIGSAIIGAVLIELEHRTEFQAFVLALTSKGST